MERANAAPSIRWFWPSYHRRVTSLRADFSAPVAERAQRGGQVSSTVPWCSRTGAVTRPR